MDEEAGNIQQGPIREGFVKVEDSKADLERRRGNAANRRNE